MLALDLQFVDVLEGVLGSGSWAYDQRYQIVKNEVAASASMFTDLASWDKERGKLWGWLALHYHVCRYGGKESSTPPAITGWELWGSSRNHNRHILPISREGSKSCLCGGKKQHSMLWF